mgnify:CR=1 FL=1
MRHAMLPVLVAMAMGAGAAPAGAQSRDAVEGLSGLPTPRFVSLSAGVANMRAGPGDRYPVTWVYKRRGLPLKVVKEYGIWRQVEDPDGEIGWINKNLVSGERTAYVHGEIQPLYTRPSTDSAVVWRVAPGVVGNLSKCDGQGWCRLSVDGKIGFVRTDAIWGTLPGEAF